MVTDFVRRPEFDVAINIVQGTIDAFMKPGPRFDEKFFIFPVVDGETGTGKSRLSWEVC